MYINQKSPEIVHPCALFLDFISYDGSGDGASSHLENGIQQMVNVADVQTILEQMMSLYDPSTTETGKRLRSVYYLILAYKKG